MRITFIQLPHKKNCETLEVSESLSAHFTPTLSQLVKNRDDFWQLERHAGLHGLKTLVAHWRDLAVESQALIDELSMEVSI